MQEGYRNAVTLDCKNVQELEYPFSAAGGHQ